MKIRTLFLGIGILLAGLSGNSSPLYAGDLDFEWKDLEGGAQYATIEAEIFGAPQHIAVLRYPMRNFRTEVVSDPGLTEPKKPEYPAAVDPDNPATTTSGYGKRYGAFAAVNAGYFNMRTLYPTTYVRDDGVQEGRTTEDETFRVDGLAAIRRGKVKIICSDTLSYGKALRGYREAIAGGPVLISKGKARTEWPESSFFTNRHPRTIIGTVKGWVYMVDIDGRWEEHAKGATIPETVEIARQLGLRDAINLDGGGSSTLWTEQTGVLSHPNDNGKWDHEGERVIPNAIVVFRK